MWARWPDGDTKEIASLTFQRWTSLGNSGAPSVGKWVQLGLVWRGLHSVTLNQLEVRPRPDRQLLVSLYEQGKQILQINTEKLSQDDDDPNCKVKKAYGLMVTIGEMYQKDLVPKEKLTEVREKEIKKLETSTPEKAKAKRKQKSTKKQIKRVVERN